MIDTLSNGRTLLFMTLLSCTASVSRAGEAEEIEFFEARIRPVLVRYCYECHSHLRPDPKGGLQLDWRTGLRAGGESGPAVVPGKSAQSLLIEAIRHESFQMPPDQKLPDTIIADFVKWIDDGAVDPRDMPPDAASGAAEAWRQTLAERRQWWSLQPVDPQAVPSVGDGSWSDQSVDRFILRKLEDNDLQPAPVADRRTLIRRLSYTLVGLPPEPREVSAFVEDPSPAAYERLVDRLLASPHFGEHFARHWMDVVRYTDTYGYEWDIAAKGAWCYRDYLTRALNQDVPFDQLVREQIAGDLLEVPRIDPHAQINESLIGTMFFQLGEKRHGDSSEFNGIHQEMLDNKIDAFSKAFQATTISCARCHDHKLDAVSQREYYSLAGVFMSSRWVTNTVDLPARNADVCRDLKQLKAQMRPLLAAAWLAEMRDLAGGMLGALPTLADQEADQEGGDHQRTAEVDRWRKLLEAGGKDPPPLESPLHVWSKLVAAAQSGDAAIPAAWNELAARYAGESAQRQRDNAAHFQLAVDFREGIPDGWSVDGTGLSEIVGCGDFVVALDGDTVVERLLPGGLFTNVLSPRLNGAVRTPYLNQFDRGHISFEVCGGDFAASRTVIDNAFLTEKQSYLNRADPGWTLMWTLNSMKDRHIFIEFATKTSNPNFPPRVGLGGACSEQQAADPRSWFGLTRVVLHEAGRTPADELTRFTSLFEREPPATLEQAARHFAGWFESSIQRWSKGQATEDDVRLINWLLGQKLLTNEPGSFGGTEIEALTSRYRHLEQRIAVPWTVNGMADIDDGFDCRLNIRGDYDQLGEEIPRGYLEVLGSSPADYAERGSGRRQLAEQIASPDNPLTARVFVNRVWQWLFGTGIVVTSSDFGHLGEQPSHPELLDYLAGRFVADGWSTKKLVRTIVLSQTWRQSGQVAPAARQRDPSNRLLHHYALRRLEAESIRDAMLAVSGRFDRQLFGSPIDPYRSNEDPQKRLFSGPVDGLGRRSIYTKITIMEPPRLLATFNQPEPKIPTGTRDVTNTPAQSLTLLNDPFVHGQAECWAEGLARIGHAGIRQRLEHMFRRALAREPTELELVRWSEAVRAFSAEHSAAVEPRTEPTEKEILNDVAVWKDVAHTMFNMKEFIYIR